MISPKELGERISLCRHQRDKTLQEVASAAGVTASTILRYEEGSFTKIKLPVIHAIATCLQVPSLSLIDDSITVCQWEHPSMHEDYWRANTQERINIVKDWGLDFAVSWDYYFVLGKLKSPNPPAEDQELLSLLEKLTPAQKQSLVSLIHTMLGE